MKAFMHHLMLSCIKATELIEKKPLDGLSGIDNVRLALHMAMCGACRQYEKQSLLLNDAISQQLNDISEKSQQKKSHLESRVKQRIQQEIENNLKK